MSLSLIDTSNLITTTSIDVDGNETTTVNYDYLEDATLITIPDIAINGDMIKAINCKEIPEDATNGDVIRALFSNVTHFDKEWWNAPYKGGGEEKLNETF